eukprot:scaffold103074_cov59-Phaeocystis_antarctica.AAC.3
MSDLPRTLAPSAPMACPARLRLARVGLPRSTCARPLACSSVSTIPPRRRRFLLRFKSSSGGLKALIGSSGSSRLLALSRAWIRSAVRPGIARSSCLAMVRDRARKATSSSSWLVYPASVALSASRSRMLNFPSEPHVSMICCLIRTPSSGTVAWAFPASSFWRASFRRFAGVLRDLWVTLPPILDPRRACNVPDPRLALRSEDEAQLAALGVYECQDLVEAPDALDRGGLVNRMEEEQDLGRVPDHLLQATEILPHRSARPRASVAVLVDGHDVVPHVRAARHRGESLDEPGEGQAPRV